MLKQLSIIFIILLINSVGCSDIKNRTLIQRQQDSLSTVQAQAQQRRDSIIRANPDRYLTIKIDSLHIYQRGMSGNEIEFTIDNQTPFTADSIKVQVYTQELKDFRRDSATYGADTITLRNLSVPQRSRQRFTTNGHFHSVDSIAIIAKHFR